MMMLEIHNPQHRLILARHQETVPVNIRGIADELGLAVYHTSEWDDDVSGQIVRSERHGGRSGYAVFLNRNHHRNRRRFTLAHEVAHFLLHQQFIGDGVRHDGLYRSGLSTPLEVEANKLAAEILMPKSQLLWAFFEGVEELDDLARRFRVSRAAMAVRLGIPPEPEKRAVLELELAVVRARILVGGDDPPSSSFQKLRPFFEQVTQADDQEDSSDPRLELPS